MSQHLILLRGVPGSGKTTFANWIGGLIAASCTQAPRVVAADDWFDQYNGSVFDPTKLGEAHAWCFSEAKIALRNGATVVVHNTFTTEKELDPYIDLAKGCGAKFTVLVVENRHGNKSVHNVPDATINRMRERLRGSIKL